MQNPASGTRVAGGDALPAPTAPPDLLCGLNLTRRPGSYRTVRGRVRGRPSRPAARGRASVGARPSRSGTRAGGVGAWGGPSGCDLACKREGLPRELRGPAKCNLSSGPLRIAGGAKTERDTVYRSETGAGVGDNGTPCPFNRTHEMISRRGTHSRIRECWGVVIPPTALSPRIATQKSPQIECGRLCSVSAAGRLSMSLQDVPEPSMLPRAYGLLVPDASTLFGDVADARVCHLT
jgi:hypothetical protein